MNELTHCPWSSRRFCRFLKVLSFIRFQLTPPSFTLYSENTSLVPLRVSCTTHNTLRHCREPVTDSTTEHEHQLLCDRLRAEVTSQTYLRVSGCCSR